MINTSDPNDKPDSKSDSELFTRIWIFPREVFRYIQETKYSRHLTVILILAGIVRAFSRAADRNMGDNHSLAVVVGTSIVLGGLLGWISYYIYAFLLSWTGKWIGGKAESKDLLRVLAYGSIPSIVALIFLIPQIGIYGVALFQSESELVGAGILENSAFWGAMIIEIILGIWTLVLIIIGVAEVQQMAVLTAILNLILPLFIFILPILLVAGVYSAF